MLRPIQTLSCPVLPPLPTPCLLPRTLQLISLSGTTTVNRTRSRILSCPRPLCTENAHYLAPVLAHLRRTFPCFPASFRCLHPHLLQPQQTRPRLLPSRPPPDPPNAPKPLLLSRFCSQLRSSPFSSLLSPSPDVADLSSATTQKTTAIYDQKQQMPL